MIIHNLPHSVFIFLGFSILISTLDTQTSALLLLITKALEHIPVFLSRKGQFAFLHTSVSTYAIISSPSFIQA